MDDLDRLYHRLLDAVRESAPQLRERRFRLGDIPQHLLPYRLHRRDLGFESVQQYEGALARLAAGERGYLNADATVQQAFRRAVDGGDVPLEQALRTHGDALVALAPETRHRPETPTSAAPAVASPTQATQAVPAAVDEAPAPPASGSAGGNGGLVIPIVRTDAAAPASAAPPAPSPAPRAAPPLETADAAGTPPSERQPAGTAPHDTPTGGGLTGALAGVLTNVLTSALTGAAPPAPAPPAPAPPPAAPSAAPAPTPAPPAPAPPPPAPSDAMPFPVRPPTPVVGGTCRNCGRPLPADRGVTFCPYCGENLTIRRCPACSTELEAGWRFCITCGREVDEPAAAPDGKAGDGDGKNT